MSHVLRNYGYGENNKDANQYAHYQPYDAHESVYKMKLICVLSGRRPIEKFLMARFILVCKSKEFRLKAHSFQQI